MNETKLIVKALRKIIIKRMIRQYDLAKILGAPTSTVNRWFKGKHDISPSWVSLIKANADIGTEVRLLMNEMSMKE